MFIKEQRVGALQTSWSRRFLEFVLFVLSIRTYLFDSEWLL